VHNLESLLFLLLDLKQGGLRDKLTIPRKTSYAGRGRGCSGAMIPAKMTFEPPDLQNYLQAPQNWSPSLRDVTKPPAILSPHLKNS